MSSLPTTLLQRYRDPRHLQSRPTRRSSDLEEGDQVLRLGEQRHPEDRAVQQRVVHAEAGGLGEYHALLLGDRKSPRLNTSHMSITYAVFSLENKITTQSINDTEGLHGLIEQ